MIRAMRSRIVLLSAAVICTGLLSGCSSQGMPDMSDLERQAVAFVEQESESGNVISSSVGTLTPDDPEPTGEHYSSIEFSGSGVVVDGVQAVCWDTGSTTVSYTLKSGGEWQTESYAEVQCDGEVVDIPSPIPAELITAIGIDTTVTTGPGATLAVMVRGGAAEE